MRNRLAGIAMTVADSASPERGPAANPAAGGEELSDDAGERRRMTRDQLECPGRDIRDARVLAALGSVPRHRFVPADLRAFAYEDRPLPIGHGQTISQPYIVAFMTEALDPQPTDRVLEIGTGSGYQAAVLATLVREVYSIEVVEPLGLRAREILRELAYTNVLVRVDDGYPGWPEFAPFDVIIVTCAPDHVPQPLVDQLKEGGRLVIPVGSPPDQALYLLEKIEGKARPRMLLPVRFVPMTGAALGHSSRLDKQNRS